jgi:hypothetical protein
MLDDNALMFAAKSFCPKQLHPTDPKPYKLQYVPGTLLAVTEAAQISCDHTIKTGQYAPPASPSNNHFLGSPSGWILCGPRRRSISARNWTRVFMLREMFT